jgi:hypothetical protein
MAWGKVSSVNGSGGSSVTTGTISTANTFQEFLIYTTAFVDGNLKFNDSGSATEYARRYAPNGGTSVTNNINLQGVEFLYQLAPAFIHGFIANVGTDDKLFVFETCETNNTTGNQTLNRMQIADKWAKTNLIEKMDITKTGTTFSSDENFTVLGSNTTPASAVSLTVQDGAIFYETDTNKSYVLNSGTWTEL